MFYEIRTPEGQTALVVENVLPGGSCVRLTLDTCMDEASLLPGKKGVVTYLQEDLSQLVEAVERGRVFEIGGRVSCVGENGCASLLVGVHARPGRI